MLTRLNGLLKNYRVASSGLLILAATSVYGGTLSGSFVYDDIHLILENPFIKNPHLWRRIFLGSLFAFDGPGAQTGYYRPLTVFSYWLVCRVSGFNPFGYHLLLLALYALSVWVVYRIGQKFLQNDLAAFAGALLWAVHPLHVEVVAWVSSLSDVGCTLFCLLAFWLFLRAEDHAPANFRWHLAAAAVYFPALFFKEVALSLPLVLLVYWFCNRSAESWVRRAIHWTPYVGAVVLCAAIRYALMGRFAGNSILRNLSGKVILAAIALLGQHAKLFFWPVNLSEFRDFDLVASMRSPWAWAVLLVLVVACLFRRRNPRLSFLVLWWAAALVPCLNYRLLTVPLVADRFSYFASVGLCLALGYLAFAWLPAHFPSAGRSWAVGGALAVIAVLWAVQTMRMVPHWRDNDSLFDYGLVVSPRAAVVHVSRGVFLQFRMNDLNGAAREFQTALRLNEQDIRPLSDVTYSSYIGLGQVALNQGREAEALDYFGKAARLEPHKVLAFMVLGSFYFPRRNYARAAEYFEQAVRVDPMETGARFYLGSCLLKLSQPARAAEQFHAAREVDPEYYPAYKAEAGALDAAGDAVGAAKVRQMVPHH